MTTTAWPVGALMTCTTLLTPVGGQSHESDYVAKRLSSLRAPLTDSRAIGVQSLLDDLHLLAQECRVEDWNGYGAKPLSPRSLAPAEVFIRCLGMNSRNASLGATAKGWVTLQWGPGPKWTLSIAITDDGWIHWAALFGSVREHGTTPFMGAIPRNISELIQRACIA